MISIVLYGRNDNYGYNLHKRAALSFNCMAELLTDDNDEILFVDYNTPDDFPTFPEAIQDTLTPLARKRLRILRVRPSVHSRFKDKTRLVALEPISRNVAVRRSNPVNRWILSTNTDMIFVPQGDRWSLSEIARDLPRGFYHAPRLEIPETLWEGLDRQKPRLAIETIKEWGSSLHLNEIVLGAKTILYDGPGDFQLIERADLFKYHGFNEEMILGWHVDSNIAKRLFLVYGKVGDLGQAVFGYHCDHTRQITPMHSHSRTHNDEGQFIESVDDPAVPEQASDWGSPDGQIEELKLTEHAESGYIAALRSAIGPPLADPPVVSYSTSSYGKIDYDPRHVLPFLADLFVSAPRNTAIGWAGVRRETLERFSKVWQQLGFSEPILVEEELVAKNDLQNISGIRATGKQTLLERAGAFVIDFGSADPTKAAELTNVQRKMLGRAFFEVVGAERSRWTDGASLRRIICLNAIHTPFEMMVQSYVAAGLTPFATRMRHGFALPPPEKTQDWISGLQAGEAGEAVDGVIRARPGATGVVCYGPYRQLLRGRYRIELGLSGKVADDVDALEPIGSVELKWGLHVLKCPQITPEDLDRGRIVLDVDVSDNMDPTTLVQTVVHTLVPTSLVVSSLICEATGRGLPLVNEMAAGFECLRLLRLGPCGQWTREQNIQVRDRETGFVAFGPYLTLPPGRYEASVELESDAGDGRPFVVVEIFSEGRYRAVSFVNGTDGQIDRCLLQFEVHEDETPTGEIPFELRVRSVGTGGVVKRATVRRIGEPTDAPCWIPFPTPPTSWARLEWRQILVAQPGGQMLRSVVRAVRKHLS